MDDLPTDPSGSTDEAIKRVLKSSLPDEQKRRVVKMLIEERQAFDRQFAARADDLIAEAERLLREQ